MQRLNKKVYSLKFRKSCHKISAGPSINSHLIAALFLFADFTALSHSLEDSRDFPTFLLKLAAPSPVAPASFRLLAEQLVRQSERRQLRPLLAQAPSSRPGRAFCPLSTPRHQFRRASFSWSRVHGRHAVIVELHSTPFSCCFITSFSSVARSLHLNHTQPLPLFSASFLTGPAAFTGGLQQSPPPPPSSCPACQIPPSDICLVQPCPLRFGNSLAIAQHPDLSDVIHRLCTRWKFDTARHRRRNPTPHLATLSQPVTYFWTPAVFKHDGHVRL